MAHLEEIELKATHRLIPAKYDSESVLENLALPPHVLTDLSELDAATNERKLAERGRSFGIGPGELLAAVPEAHVVNAAFCHPGPLGGRFHTARRGAWYAGVEIETSLAEVAFHKRRFLREGRIEDRYTFEYVDFLADFSGSYHALDAEESAACLVPAPVPECYAASQALANRLLFAGSNGMVYRSVRRRAGRCVACFRPALVFHPRRGGVYRLKVAAEE